KEIVSQKVVQSYLDDQKSEDLRVLCEADLNLTDCRVLVLGGGGHAKICIDILRHMQAGEIVGIVDPEFEVGSIVFDVPVLGGDDRLATLHQEGIKCAANGLGAINNHPKRQQVYNDLVSTGFTLPNLIHFVAAIEASAKFGHGNQIMANATVGSAVVVSNNCIINAGAIVSHDSVLKDNVHIAPGAIIGGNVTIGKNTLVGMGATIYLGVKIGRNVVINNGADVVKDIPDNTVVRRPTG
ncbi:acetyltransferase, partial [Oligoflexia bacterium]|nr:acetyltransferase [Oligoflexia bacterium]